MSVPISKEGKYEILAITALGATVILGALAVIGNNYFNFPSSAVHYCLGGMAGSAIITMIMSCKAYSLARQRIAFDEILNRPDQVTPEENFATCFKMNKQTTLALITYKNEVKRFVLLTQSQVEMANQYKSDALQFTTDSLSICRAIVSYFSENEFSSPDLTAFGEVCANYSSEMHDAFNQIEFQ